MYSYQVNKSEGMARGSVNCNCIKEALAHTSVWLKIQFMLVVISFIYMFNTMGVNLIAFPLMVVENNLRYLRGYCALSWVEACQV